MATEESDDVVSTTFPKEICFIDAQINSLFEFHLDPGLISINLHCNNISVIENLDRLQHLKHLDLSSNHITRIQGLGGLKSLKTLNLSCNELQIVEGLENLRYCLLSILVLRRDRRRDKLQDSTESIFNTCRFYMQLGFRHHV